MGKNPIVAVIAVIVLIVAVVLIIKGMTGSDVGSVGEAPWYDTGSGKLYGGPTEMLPPAPAPSGSEGVSAAVYSKSSCENKADRFIVYLSKWTKEGKPLIEAARANASIDVQEMGAITGEHSLVKRVDDTEWVAVGTAEGKAILAETMQTGIVMCSTHLE